MNQDSHYCRMVLEGMRQQGLTDSDIARIVSVPLSRIKSVLREQAALTEREFDRIEDEIGLTIGQLAASTLGDDAQALKELMDECAAVKWSDRIGPKALAPKRSKKNHAARSR